MVHEDTDHHITRCKNEVYGTVKVQVVHYKSGVRRWQTWHLCKLCLVRFVEEKGQGYFSCKTKTREPIAQVIDFKLPEIGE
jgi:hypothetical protein